MGTSARAKRETICRPPCALVVTSIASSAHPVLRQLAYEARVHGVPLVLVGDTKSPQSGVTLPGADFYSPTDPRLDALPFARICPTSTYARKNIGYLIAAKMGIEWLVETDDDNEPKGAFWQHPREEVSGREIKKEGWVNAYAAFTNKFIYPRGLPLDEARGSVGSTEPSTRISPIQQRLVDGDPDVDAVYRLLFDLPFNFSSSSPLLLQKNQWCPFNSQNTVFFRRAFPLLYLPTYCSFRMTDIWRSFVAQRVLQLNGYSLSFHEPNAIQYRNEHDLMGDFALEVPGYLENKQIVERLSSLTLPSGDGFMAESVLLCYEAMIQGGWLPEKELPLVTSWMSNLTACLKS